MDTEGDAMPLAAGAASSRRVSLEKATNHNSHLDEFGDDDALLIQAAEHAEAVSAAANSAAADSSDSLMMIDLCYTQEDGNDQITLDIDGCSQEMETLAVYQSETDDSSPRSIE
jgi:hypothetical protein